MTRRKLEELNVLDNFLFQQLVSRGEEGEDFCRRILEPILGKKIGRIKIAPQKPLAGFDTDLHGIRLDAYVEAAEPGVDMELESEIYDIEPNKTVERERLPKRTRFYQGLIDARLLDGGWDYRQLKRVVVIMILPYDPFGMNRMVYTVKNQCIEDSNVEYDDGALKIFLNTKGTSGDTSQELQKMLKYIECSIAENVANDNIQAIHDYVEKVKKDKDVEVQYMKSWEVEQLIREEAQKEGLEKGRKEGLEQGHIELRDYVLEVRAGNTTIEQLREKGVKQELLEIIQELV
ncbi:MAG: Rpn family recombination-promoting nuclease/putative transposase [Lachnospiraceae bacterium]|nr:Rpn family recombination-promoting nuclease/putative transposase [Lachnospiraceae bacterium]